MTLEDRLRQMVYALPTEAGIMLPVAVLRMWLNEEADDPLADLTVAEVVTKFGRAEGTVRAWIGSGELAAYWLGREYRITRSALATFRVRQRERQGPPELPASASVAPADLGAWRKVRDIKEQATTPLNPI